jgi:hypothetical protein
LLGLLLCAGSMEASVDFASPALFVTPPDTAAVAKGDFNRDGLVDVAVVTGGVGFQQAQEVVIYFGTKSGTLTRGPDYNLSYSPGSVAVADVNGDGKADVIVSAYPTDRAFVAVLLGNGDGTFQAPTYTTTAGGAPTGGGF